MKLQSGFSLLLAMAIIGTVTAFQNPPANANIAGSIWGNKQRIYDTMAGGLRMTFGTAFHFRTLSSQEVRGVLAEFNQDAGTELRRRCAEYAVDNHLIIAGRGPGGREYAIATYGFGLIAADGMANGEVRCLRIQRRR